jgi:hypothetical protein
MVVIYSEYDRTCDTDIKPYMGATFEVPLISPTFRIRLVTLKTV